MFFIVKWIKSLVLLGLHRAYENAKHETYELFKTKMPKSGKRWWKRTQPKLTEAYDYEWWNSQRKRFWRLSKTYKTRENSLLKSLIGFICGVIITCAISFFCVLVLNMGAEMAAVASSTVGLSYCFFLGFNDRARGSMLMFLPRIFGSEGRTLFKLYLLILITSGPVKNTLRNLRILTDSVICVQGKAQNVLNSMENLIKRPIVPIEESLKVVLDKVKLVKNAAKEIMMTIKIAVVQIVGIVRASFGFSNGIVKLCNTKVGSPFHTCLKSIELVSAGCKAKLGSRCEGIGACSTESLLRDICRSTRSKDLCAADSPLPTSTVIKSVKGLRKLANHLRNMFNIAFVTEHDANYKLYNGKGNHFRVYQDVAGIVEVNSYRLDVLIQVIGFSMAVYGIYSIYSCNTYGKYVTRAWYDNCFVTENLTVIEVNRKQLNKERIFPLRRWERQKYFPISSHELVGNERIRYTSLPITYFFTMMKILITVGFDLGLVWYLKRLHRIGHIPLKYDGLRNVEVLTNATGPLWGIYKTNLDAFQPKWMGEKTDLTTCFAANPHEPDYSRYHQICLVTLLYTLVSFLGPHGQRLRVLIIERCYPHLAKRRAVWLFNHIQRIRTISIKLARRNLRRKYHECGEDAIPLWKMLLAQVRSHLIHYGDKLWGHNVENEEEENQVCLHCECQYPPETLLVKCPTLKCQGLYCNCCFEELGKLCVLCHLPEEYGDLSDVSEERDSSEEENNFTCEDDRLSELDSDWWIDGMETDYDYCYVKFPRDPCDLPTFHTSCRYLNNCNCLNFATIENADLPDKLDYLIEKHRHEEFSLHERVKTPIMCSIAPDLCENKIKFENPSWQVTVDKFIRNAKLEESKKVTLRSLRRRSSHCDKPRVIQTYFSETVYTGPENDCLSGNVSSHRDCLSNSPRKKIKRKLKEEKCQFCQNLRSKRCKFIFPVHMNNFKSRDGSSKSASPLAHVDSEKCNTSIGKESSIFEHRKVESSFAPSDRSPRTTALSSTIGSHRKPIHRQSESPQRNKSSWGRQSPIMEYSSSDESTMPCRPQRKHKKWKSSSKSSSSLDITGSAYRPKESHRSKYSHSTSISYDADVGSLQVSSDSVNEYLTNVSKELEEERLLGKLDLISIDGGGDRRRAASEKLNVLTTNFMYVAEDLKQKRLMSIRNAAQREKKSSTTNTNNIEKEGATFWKRMSNVFSMACWRGHAGASDYQNSESGDDSVDSEKESTSTNSSTSSETMTVVPASRASHRLEGIKPKTSSSVSRDEKFVAAKLVESLKRFFSINPEMGDGGCRPQKNQMTSFERIDEEDESDHQSEDSSDSVSSNLPPSLPLPLPPYSTANSTKSYHTSDYEVVDVNPKHRQPM